MAIKIKKANVGKFTQWASAHGMGVQEAARHVMANKEDYSSTIVKRANFAKNAAGWKHQYGGSTMRRYADGGVTDENPIGGATTFTGQNPAGMSTTAPTQNSYDPSTDANNPVNQNIPMPQQGGYAAAQGAVWDETGTTDGQPEEEQMTTDELTKQRRPIGTGYRNLLGAAMMYGNYAANQRQQKNLQAYGIQQGITQMKPTPNPWGKGVYNQQGQMMQPQGRYGGTMQYQTGGVYEVDENEIQDLIRKGYKVKYM